AYYGTPPEEGSAGLYHALAREGMHVTLFALRDGAGSFAASLAAAIERAGGRLAQSEAVHAVESDAAGVRLRTSAGEALYDRVIVAAPPGAAAELVADAGLRQWLSGVHTRPAVSL